MKSNAPFDPTGPRRKRSSVAAAASAAASKRRMAAGDTALNPATSDRHYEPDEVEFLAAVSEYQRKTDRKFPTFCELLLIAKSLGYAKVRETPMRQAIESNHLTEEGKPAGGQTVSTGLKIDWQNGALVKDGQRVEPNGAFVETVIRAALDRIEYYQSTQFSCRENALAITKLQEALHWLGHRTAEREARGVEGTHQK